MKTTTMTNEQCTRCEKGIITYMLECGCDATSFCSCPAGVEKKQKAKDEYEIVIAGWDAKKRLELAAQDMYDMLEWVFNTVGTDTVTFMGIRERIKPVLDKAKRQR